MALSKEELLKKVQNFTSGLVGRIWEGKYLGPYYSADEIPDRIRAFTDELYAEMNPPKKGEDLWPPRPGDVVEWGYGKEGNQCIVCTVTGDDLVVHNTRLDTTECPSYYWVEIDGSNLRIVSRPPLEVGDVIENETARMRVVITESLLPRSAGGFPFPTTLCGQTAYRICPSPSQMAQIRASDKER